MLAGPVQGSYGLHWGKEATRGDRGQDVPKKLHQWTGPEETSYPEGLKDGEEVPGLRYEDVQPRWRQMGAVHAGGMEGGAGEGWLSGVYSGSRGEAGSGGELARDVQDEGRDSVACCGRKQG